MNNVAKLQWKWKELIVALDGPKAVCDHIARRGVRPPSWNTVKGWQTRNSVPGRFAPLMILIGMEEKVLPSVNNLWAGFGK
jgi:hypothetical protein